MKQLIAIAGLALMTSAAWAHDEHFGGNDDMYNSPILDHGPGETVTAVQRGVGDQYASILITQPADHTHMADPADNSKWDPDGSLELLHQEN